jgi:nucleotide-binding universal stress UspA family protein
MTASAGTTIVVGVDGSDHADRALAWAIDEAKLRTARMRVVTAWHVPAMVYGAPGFMPAVSPSADESTFNAVWVVEPVDATRGSR